MYGCVCKCKAICVVHVCLCNVMCIIVCVFRYGDVCCVCAFVCDCFYMDIDLWLCSSVEEDLVAGGC